MRRFRYHLKHLGIDSRTWYGVVAICVIATMMAYSSLKTDYRLVPSAYYFFILSFNVDLAMATYLVAAGQASITAFCDDYHHNRLYFILPRMGYGRYAWFLVARTVVRTYVIGCVGSFLYLMLVVSRFPLRGNQELDGMLDSMINGWLLTNNQRILFYALLISMVGLMLAFYTLLGLWLTIYYPNKLVSFMLPVLLWFMLTQFDLARILPFFLVPQGIFGTSEYLYSAMTHYQLGSEPVRKCLALIYPYLFMVLVCVVVATMIAQALRRQWHFFDKEGL